MHIMPTSVVHLDSFLDTDQNSHDCYIALVSF